MYVNAYVLSVTEENKNDYIKIANIFADVAKDFGALEIFENWEKEIPDGETTDFRQAVKAKEGEKIVLSWIVWPDRESCSIAHEGMFKDERMSQIGEMPFDGKKMILGGFEPILRYRKEK